MEPYCREPDLTDNLVEVPKLLLLLFIFAELGSNPGPPAIQMRVVQVIHQCFPVSPGGHLEDEGSTELFVVEKSVCGGD